MPVSRIGTRNTTSFAVSLVKSDSRTVKSEEAPSARRHGLKFHHTGALRRANGAKYTVCAAP